MDTQLKDSEGEDVISPSTIQRIGNAVELCLCCCSKLAGKEKIEKVVSESLVEHNLFVIFLLKNVLQVPDSQLQENLKELGNPVDWIRLCEQCTQLAAHALNLHCKIVKLDRELWEVQKLIVEKTKQSSTNLVAAGTVWGRTRQFVKNSTFQSASFPVNPFIRGDKLATANLYFKQQTYSSVFPFHLGDHDQLNHENIKSEQLNSQSISDNEGDEDWQPDESDDDYNEQLNSQEIGKVVNKKKRESYPARKRVNGKIKCNFCPKLFFNPNGVWGHEKEKHPSIPKQHVCPLCARASNSLVYLRLHMKRKHKARLDGSPLFPNFAKQDRNGNEGAEEQRLGAVASRVKAQPSGGQASRSELEDKPARKVIKRAIKEPRLRVDGKVKCYYCHKLFSFESGCYRHEQEAHASSPAQFPCTLCDKAFKTKGYFKRHARRVHQIETESEEEEEEDSDNDEELDIPCSPESPEPVSDNEHEEKDEGEEGNNEHVEDLNKCVVVEGGQLSPSIANIPAGPGDKEKATAETHGEAEGEGDVESKMKKVIGKLALVKQATKLDENKKKKRFACQVCGKGFPQKSKHERHERVFRRYVAGDGKGLRACELCEARFVSRECLRWHNFQKHGISTAVPLEKRPFSCKLCDKRFSTSSSLARHQSFHKKLDSMQKKRRRKEEGTRQVVNKVALAKTKKRVCEGKRSKLKGVSGANEVKVKCRICDREFLGAFRLKSHERTHKFQELMGRLGRRKGANRKFEWVDGKVKCGKCDKLFLSSTACRSHEAEKHAESPAQFICDICGKAWNSEAYLRTHRNHTHHLRADGTPYVPKYRIQKPKKEYEFYGRREGYGQLMADGRRIRGTKYEAVDGKLKCRSCDKVFARQASVYKHEYEKHPKVPGGYICTHCGLAFNSLDYMRIHSERKHRLKLDGSTYIPPWIAKKMKKQEEKEMEQDLSATENVKKDVQECSEQNVHLQN